MMKNRRLKKNPIKKVLDGISLDIYKGECFGIIGANGTGKSTLLKLISGIIPADSGSVRVNGSLIPLLSLGVGFSDDLTAHDNIYQYGMILGFSKKDIDDLYDDIIAFADLEKYQYMPLKNYSTGMRVKLGFSTAMNINPDILLLDEVLSVGDISFREKSRQKILEFCNSEKTVVIVSHTMSTIYDLCNRAMYLDNGKIGMIGDTTEVIDAYVAAMHDSLGPTELAFTQKRSLDKERQKQDQDYVHFLNDWISGLQILPLIKSTYSPDVERSLNEYLIWKNLTKSPHYEELLEGNGEGHRPDEFVIGKSSVSFLVALGERSGSRSTATELMGHLCRDGFVCFGDSTLTAFFLTDTPGSRVPEELAVILIRDGARDIPVIFDKEKMVKVDDASVYKILQTIHCSDPQAATLIIDPDLYTMEGIAAIREKKIPFVAPVHVREIEEQQNLLDFFDGIIAPERMQIFADAPIFAKRGRFDVKGGEIDGYGYFNPRVVLKEYKSYFKNLEMFKKVFERSGKVVSVNPEVFIRDVAKGNSRYFSGTKNGMSLEIGFNPDTVYQRQKLLGMVFLYYSGTWNALDCYRNFERWKMTGECFNLYRQIITSDTALHRGKALLSLINMAVRIGLL
jgi:ABC-type polysaccharide/polyol phosphate transport system ATPase subunit